MQVRDRDALLEHTTQQIVAEINGLEADVDRPVKVVRGLGINTIEVEDLVDITISTHRLGSIEVALEHAEKRYRTYKNNEGVARRIANTVLKHHVEMEKTRAYVSKAQKMCHTIFLDLQHLLEKHGVTHVRKEFAYRSSDSHVVIAEGQIGGMPDLPEVCPDCGGRYLSFERDDNTFFIACEDCLLHQDIPSDVCRAIKVESKTPLKMQATSYTLNGLSNLNSKQLVAVLEALCK